MTRPAAIAGSLVNMKNVGVHKSVALTIHVPEEQAQAVIEAFGWPTAANPVPVAIARLDVKAPEEPRQIEAPKKKWEDLSPAQQAAIRCADSEFWEFIEPKRGFMAENSDEVDRWLKQYLNIGSKKELETNYFALAKWRNLEDEFYRWQRGMR